MMLKPTKKLSPPDWMLDETVQRLYGLLNEGGEPQTLFVGGAIRNWLLNRSVQDIDLATKLSPENVMARLSAAGIKAIPTGIKHGTVTAHMAGQNFEITTLRRDVATDGRHAEVAYSTDWAEDAARRDFTINTLLADIEGHIYDPLGAGLDDIVAQKIVFVGEPARRIQEDYLRILRFFRFHGFYGAGAMDAAALAACQAHGAQITSLSRERITAEFLKILSLPHAVDVLDVMFMHDVLADLPHENYKSDTSRNLIKLQDEHDLLNVETRLFVLAGCQPGLFTDYLRLSNAQQKFIIKLGLTCDAALYADEKAVKKGVYHHGADLMAQGYLLHLAQLKSAAAAVIFEIIQNWQAPKFPYTGEMLMAEGFEQGPMIGQELRLREEEWLEEML